jgi:hypothetical protein
MIKRGKAEKSAARSERLSAALRENLKRRKEQARKRQIERAVGPATDTGTNDGPGEWRIPEFRRNPGRD